MQGLLTEPDLKKKEAEAILKSLEPQDYFVVLDEKGKSLGSVTVSRVLTVKGKRKHKTGHISYWCLIFTVQMNVSI